MIRPNDFELFLVRHGQPESWADGGDPARALTSKGAEAIERVGKAFVKLGWSWSEAWSSPYLRAKQTSALVRQALVEAEVAMPYEVPEIQEDERLVVHASPKQTARWLVEHGQRMHGPRPSLAAFGHQPNLAAVAALLLSDEADVQIALGQGDVIHLFVHAPSPFDTLLDPQQEEPLPKATLLGFYPRHTLESIGRTLS